MDAVATRFKQVVAYFGLFPNACGNSFNVCKPPGVLAIKFDTFGSTSVFVYVIVLSTFASRALCVAVDTGLFASKVRIIDTSKANHSFGDAADIARESGAVDWRILCSSCIKGSLCCRGYRVVCVCGVIHVAKSNHRFGYAADGASESGAVDLSCCNQGRLCCRGYGIVQVGRFYRHVQLQL